jgi:hypothetical protein
VMEATRSELVRHFVEGLAVPPPVRADGVLPASSQRQDARIVVEFAVPTDRHVELESAAVEVEAATGGQCEFGFAVEVERLVECGLRCFGGDRLLRGGEAEREEHRAAGDEALGNGSDRSGPPRKTRFVHEGRRRSGVTGHGRWESARIRCVRATSSWPFSRPFVAPRSSSTVPRAGFGTEATARRHLSAFSDAGGLGRRPRASGRA